MNQERILPYFLASLHPEVVAEFFSGLEPLTAEDWDELARLILRQRVAPLLGWQFKTHQLPPGLPAFVSEQLEHQYCKNAMRNQCLMRELGVLLHALYAAEIPVIVLKGAYLASAIYDDPAQRVMTDIDLLVPETQITEAQECLRVLGYTTDVPFEPEPYLASKHHLPAFHKVGAVAAVELHWNITVPGRSWSIHVDELWRRAVPFQIAGTQALRLCLEDGLLYLCYHATYHHLLELFWHGIGPVCDVDRMIRRFASELDWNVIVERAQAWQWSRGGYLQLSLAVELLKTPVPPDVLRQLEPGGSNPQVFCAAATHLFVPKGTAQRVSSHMVSFWQEERAIDKVKGLLKSLFPSPAEMSIRYRVALYSPALWFYYPAYLAYLARRWSRKVWGLWRGEQVIPRLSPDQYLVMKWLEQP